MSEIVSKEIYNKEKIDESNKYNETNLEYKNYCSFVIPKERNITPIDDLLNIKPNIKEFKDEILRNLGIEKISDIDKIEERNNLLYIDVMTRKKWYLYFQPLNNISIEQYWKYDKVTLKDIITCNINTSQNIELKRNKKYLKHIAKCILKGVPHESLRKSAYKTSTQYLYDSNIFYKLNTAPLLNLKSKYFNNNQSLINWKFPYARNLSTVQNIKSLKRENLSFVNVNTKHKSDIYMNQGNSDIVSNKHKKVKRSKH